MASLGQWSRCDDKSARGENQTYFVFIFWWYFLVVFLFFCCGEMSVSGMFFGFFLSPPYTYPLSLLDCLERVTCLLEAGWMRRNTAERGTEHIALDKTTYINVSAARLVPVDLTSGGIARDCLSPYFCSFRSLLSHSQPTSSSQSCLFAPRCARHYPTASHQW